MKERGITDGLTMNQLAERNAEYVMTIAELEDKCAAMTAKLSMINDLMEAAEQANKLAQEATENLVQERNALAAENAGLKAAFDKPQAYLSWHAIPPTREDPLPCGEYLDAHDDAGHKNSDGTDCWPVYSRPEIETPATDAFLAEVRASALDEFAKVQDEQAKKYYELSPGCSGQNECQFAAGQAWYYAECIRKGAAQ